MKSPGPVIRILFFALFAAFAVTASAQSPVAPSFALRPDTLPADQTSKTLLVVRNTTDKVHGFSIDAFRIKDTVKPGQRLLVKLTPTQTGRFTIYCQLHPAHLKTELNVT